MMNSIALPSLPAVFNGLLYRHSNPTMLLFPHFDPTVITVEIDAVCGCDNFRSSVPFGLLQSDNITTPCSTGPELDVDAADIVNAVDSFFTSVERAKRELIQPRPRLAAL